MIPTAVRFAAVSSKPVSAGSSVSKTLINIASVSAIGGLFIGWPYLIASLEKKNHGAGTVPIPETKDF